MLKSWIFAKVDWKKLEHIRELTSWICWWFGTMEFYDFSIQLEWNVTIPTDVPSYFSEE